MNRTIATLGATASAGLLMASGLSVPADAHTTGIHDNCTNFNKRYPNGVGLRNAVDQGGDSTNFLRNKRIYWRAEHHNGDLDRDNDRIACEGS